MIGTTTRSIWLIIMNATQIAIMRVEITVAIIENTSPGMPISFFFARANAEKPIPNSPTGITARAVAAVANVSRKCMTWVITSVPTGGK